MKIDVRFRALDPSDALREHALRRVHFHLSRFGHEISSVRLLLCDVNGPKGGVDKQCRVTIKGRRLSTIVVDDLSGDAYSAVDAAVQRTGQTVGRSLERVRHLRSRAPTGRLSVGEL